MALQPNGRAPYTTATAAITALDAWRDRGFGTPVTADVLTRAGVPESISKRTLQSLRDLELLENKGQPTAALTAFQQTRGDQEYRAALQDWLRDVYGDVLQYCDPSTDTPERINEAFRTYEPSGQRAAMASLLIGLWRYAGLPVAVSDNTAKKARSASPTRKRTQKDSKKKPDEPSSNLSNLPPGLVGLLHQIPGQGGTWTSDRRESFLKAFEAILDFTIEVDDSPDEVISDEEGETP